MVASSPKSGSWRSGVRFPGLQMTQLAGCRAGSANSLLSILIRLLTPLIDPTLLTSPEPNYLSKGLLKYHCILGWSVNIQFRDYAIQFIAKDFFTPFPLSSFLYKLRVYRHCLLANHMSLNCKHKLWTSSGTNVTNSTLDKFYGKGFTACELTNQLVLSNCYSSLGIHIFP